MPLLPKVSIFPRFTHFVVLLFRSPAAISPLSLLLYVIDLIPKYVILISTRSIRVLGFQFEPSRT